MRIKLDENLPTRLVQVLAGLGQDQDLDFSDTRKLAPGSHHGLLLVRLGDLHGKRR